MNEEVPPNSREATLTMLLKQGQSSASSLASCLGISVQAMRRHLRLLQEDGLVKSFQLAQGPGRPSNLWELTSQGHNYFNKGADKFALELFSSLQENLSPVLMNTLLNNQTKQKAKYYCNTIGSGSLKDRLQKLVVLRVKEGYLAECHSDKDSCSWYLNTFHCSISSIAEKFPVLCDQELELIRYVFADCEVKRVQWRIEYGHSCGFFITPIKENG